MIGSVEPARKLRVLVLEPDPSYGGGSEAVILSLSRELAGRGHALSLLHETEGSMLAAYREFSSQIVRAPLPGFALRSPLRTLACVARIGRVARALRADVVLSSHLGFTRHAALLSVSGGVPFCFHLGLPLVGGGASLRAAHRLAGQGIAPSAHTLETWRAGGWPAAALQAVPNWVDPGRFAPATDRAALRSELGIPVDGPCVVFVGRVCEQKGVDVLLRALPAVAAAIPNVTVLVVGAIAAGYHAQLEHSLDLLDTQTRERIVLRPVTATPEKYYACADVVCAPSIGDETFGLAALEAMACGVPVVASDVGIVAQIIGADHDVLLVPPGDAVALAERLIYWLNQPHARDACGRRLRARVLEHFAPDASVDAYERALVQLTGHPAGVEG